MVRNILAVIAGIVVGGIVNMAIVTIGPAIIPFPPGTDMSTPEGVTAALPLLETRHFMVPFAAHAIGTLVGALTAAMIAVGSKTTLAMVVGGFFFIGGVVACLMIPAPMWFIALDLIVAYIPMAWIGAKLGGAGKAAV